MNFTTPNISDSILIGLFTTCAELIGVHIGDTSVLGSYTAPDSVNLAGTTCFYIRSNLRTRNIDPRTLGFSSIIANIPITKPHNGLERFAQSGFSFGLRERSIYYIVIEVLDDDLQPVTFHGGGWQVTLEFAVEEAESYTGRVDYRSLMATQNESFFGREKLRQVNGRTRLEVNLSEPLALFETLAPRLELYTLIIDNTVKAMAASYTPRIEALEDEVEALSSKFLISYEDLLDKPALLEGERGAQGLSTGGARAYRRARAAGRAWAARRAWAYRRVQAARRARAANRAGAARRKRRNYEYGAPGILRPTKAAGRPRIAGRP